MKTATIYILFIALFALIACGKRERKTIIKPTQKTELKLKDGMVYGLACEDCNDTFLIMIPTEGLGGKPVKFNILRAFKYKRVIGKPAVGDWCCVMLNPKDSTIADMVINLDMLKGNWAHLVMPTEKENARQMITLDDVNANPDSVLQQYMIPVERGFQLMRHSKAASIGVSLLGSTVEEENNYVEYPSASRYASWRISHGQLILSEADSIIDPNDPTLTHMILNKNCEHDTVDLVMLQKDSLQIGYGGKVSSYYRQK